MSGETVTVLAGQHGLGTGYFKGPRWYSKPQPHLSQGLCHPDVHQCGTAASESTPDSELLTVLSAEAARVAGEEAQTRKLSRDRSYAGAADLN